MLGMCPALCSSEARFCRPCCHESQTWWFGILHTQQSLMQQSPVLPFCSGSRHADGCKLSSDLTVLTRPSTHLLRGLSGGAAVGAAHSLCRS